MDKLSSKEVREKRDKGLCFRCNEKTYNSRKNQKLFHIELALETKKEEQDCDFEEERVNLPAHIGLSANSLASIVCALNLMSWKFHR